MRCLTFPWNETLMYAGIMRAAEGSTHSFSFGCKVHTKSPEGNISAFGAERFWFSKSLFFFFFVFPWCLRSQSISNSDIDFRKDLCTRTVSYARSRQCGSSPVSLGRKPTICTTFFGQVPEHFLMSPSNAAKIHTELHSAGRLGAHTQ